MAAEFIQRIVIDGPAEDVKRLESALVRTGERRSRRKRWVERVPFSFEAVWKLAQLPGTPPYDPYDLSEFRRRTTQPGYAEKRYSFLTRNMTAADVLTPLSRVFPALTFRVGQMCEGEIEHYLIRSGKTRVHRVPQRRIDKAYRDYGRKHGLTLEEMEDRFYPLSDAEWDVFDATFNFWHRVAPRRRLPQRPQSWDAPTVRALDDEQVYALEG